VHTLFEFEEIRDFSFKAYLLALNGARQEQIDKFANLYFPELEVARELGREKLKQAFEELLKHIK